MCNPDAFPNFASVQIKWAEVENEQTEFVNGLTNELLERNAPISRNTRQIDALDATPGEPLHIPPRPSRFDDAAAEC